MTAMAVHAPTGSAGRVTTAFTVASRTGWRLVRTPQVLGIAVVQSVLFLLMFRYLMGGVIGLDGISYVDFLVPGFVVSGLIFTARGGAVAVAEDAASGLYDRLRSLPIAGVAVLAGRVLADATLMVFVAFVTLSVGVGVGFRFGTGTGTADWLAALGLIVAASLAFSWVVVRLGLVSGSAQAAQGLSILGVPFAFLSSAFVPLDTMPAAVRAFAEHQPLTFMVDAGRGLVIGGAASTHGTTGS